MQDIGIACGKPPDVHRSEGSSTVYLTFRGLRDSNVVDRDYRVRVTLPVAQVATTLARLLADVSSAD